MFSLTAFMQGSDSVYYKKPENWEVYLLYYLAYKICYKTFFYDFAPSYYQTVCLAIFIFKAAIYNCAKIFLVRELNWQKWSETLGGKIFA